MRHTTHSTRKLSFGRTTWCMAMLLVCALAGCNKKEDAANKPAGTSETAKPTDSAGATAKQDTKSAKQAGPAEWGTLKGRFVYDGKAPEPKAFAVGGGPALAPCCAGGCPKDNSLLVAQDGGLANVVVYLRTDKDEKVAIHPDYEKTADGKVEFDNKGCMFEPHVVVMRTSETLIIKNTDPIGHNTNLQPIKSANRAMSQVIASGGDIPYKFKVAETLPTPAVCNIHPWMRGYILARDDPYATKTAEDGTFEIKNLPAGTELEFQLWHERSGYLSDVVVAGKAAKRGRFTYKVKPGENDLGEIKVPAAKLVRK